MICPVRLPKLELRTSDFVVLTVVLAVNVAVLIFDRSMARPLFFDEHQFIASGALMARKGLMPYLDFAYAHTPNMVFLYAGLFLVTDHLLFAARVFSAVCAYGWLGLVFWFVFRLFRDQRNTVRFGLALASVGLLLSDSLFIFTFGRAWNHDPSMLMVLAAFIFHCRAGESERPSRCFFWSGFFIALAVGTRVQWAPSVAGFLLAVVFHPEYGKSIKRRVLFGAFFLGAIVGSLPTLVLFAMGPYEFWWGTITKAYLSADYTSALSFTRGFTLTEQLAYLAERFAKTGTAVICLLFLYYALRRRGKDAANKIAERFAFRVVLVFLPFAILPPVFMIKPCWPQYYFAPMPFLVLGAMLALRLGSRSVVRRADMLLCLAALAVGVVGAVGQYRDGDHARLRPTDFDERGAWGPVVTHEQGQRILEHVPKGKVLTLTPIFPLEAGLDIYEELAMGEFSVNSSHRVTPEDRRKLTILAEEDYESRLKDDPPAGILVGISVRELEAPLLRYAQEHGYESTRFSQGGTLWYLPQPDSGEKPEGD